MGMLMLVADDEAGEPVLGPSAAESLGRLGVTRVALLRDGASVGVVLEGWSFSSSFADQAARAIFPASSSGLRMFTEVESVVVSAIEQQGRN
ncbi:MAG: hypothetical protein M3N29_05265 [Chloroflexota bacterium]|nr:hypothetical protein [Chloroflexota bacterium]